MKKWFRFFFLSFFSHKVSRESVRRGYGNVFLGFILALVFLWAGFTFGDMLPFEAHYGNSPDFVASVQSVFADADTRICAEIEKGDLKVKKQGGEYAETLLINTFERDSDRQIYSVNGYNVVVDSRPANTLAEIEAYCISNDGKGTEISYEDYLTLSQVARLNFDFKLRYTGRALELDDETVEKYRVYVDGVSAENKSATEKLASDLAEGLITKPEYNRGIYELYFANYYPEISAYESTSKVPLLRNYYYHNYISQGVGKYLFVFDDYMIGSFETERGIELSFYGFYSNLDDGVLIADGSTEAEARELADGFIKNAFRANWFLNAYAYVMNVISIAPFIALMLMVAALLCYSVLKLWGVESIASLGGMLKTVGSFVWFSGITSALFSVILSFFVKRSLVNALPLVLFFAVLVIRSVIFIIKENKSYVKLLEQQEAEQTEV